MQFYKDTSNDISRIKQLKVQPTFRFDTMEVIVSHPKFYRLIYIPNKHIVNLQESTTYHQCEICARYSYCHHGTYAACVDCMDVVRYQFEKWRIALRRLTDRMYESYYDKFRGYNTSITRLNMRHLLNMYYDKLDIFIHVHVVLTRSLLPELVDIILSICKHYILLNKQIMVWHKPWY